MFLTPEKCCDYEMSDPLLSGSVLLHQFAFRRAKHLIFMIKCVQSRVDLNL